MASIAGRLTLINLCDPYTLSEPMIRILLTDLSSFGESSLESTPFLRPRLVGDRFSGHAIPLEFLKDLAVLEELIIEVAKAKYLEQNTDRKRCPQGFTDGISLKLSAIHSGSAIPVIELELPEETLFPTENQMYIEQARDSVVGAIGAAEHNQTITDYLPEKTLGYFDRIGRSLRTDEAIEFTTETIKTPSKLTRESRRRLILASQMVKEITEETSIRGLVPEADQQGMSFELKPIFGPKKVPAPISPQHKETVLQAFNDYESGARVLLQGIGIFNRNDHLLRMESIEHVSILDDLDVPARLDEMRSLKKGWLDGHGKPPSHIGLDWLSEAFTKHYPDDEIPLPYLYPTEDGGISAEWTLGDFEISLEINLETKHAEWHVLNMQTDNEVSETQDMNDAEFWPWLIAQIQTMNEVSDAG